MIAGKAYNSTHFDIPLYVEISPMKRLENIGAIPHLSDGKGDGSAASIKRPPL